MVNGSLLADRYRIDNLIGRGGMGSVWLATDVRSLRPVVVKILSRQIASFPVAVTRFLREMRVHALVRSPHIVELHDRGVDVNVGPYLVMERLEGEDLEQRINRSGPLGLSDVKQIARQVGSALQTIHAHGFVHRDVKPANVFLCSGKQGAPLAKLLDFGAVKADLPLRANGQGTTPGMLIGTLTRMSPEQIQGGTADERTDVWGLAMMVYEALIGNPAIHSDWSMGEIITRICCDELPRPSEKDPRLPASFDAWYERSTKHDADERYASIRDQVDALMAVCEEHSSQRPTATPPSLLSIVAPNPRIIEVDGPVRPFPRLLEKHTANTAEPVPDSTGVRAQGGALARQTQQPPGPWQAALPVIDAAYPKSTWPAPPLATNNEAEPCARLKQRRVNRPAVPSMQATLRPPREWPSNG